ncbi:S8 family peptidase [Halobacteriovorax sp.]|uniref:S8 family peptidase n=1 Tax=Halobacteriovorax sp. TaxID=2020862 RepID=UPI003AF24786
MRTHLLKTLLLSAVYLVVNANSIDLVSRQWSIDNNSQSYSRKVSELEFKEIKGVDGVDINYFSDEDLESIDDKKSLVAIIDTGVDIDHPELKDNIWLYPECIGKSEEEKKELPCRGYNVLDGNADVSDNEGHGTFVAGLLSAKKDGVGIDGLLPKNIKIMPIKAITNFQGFTYKGKVVSSYIARAIAFAVNNGADVINLSLGIPKVIETPQLISAIDYALEKDVIVVAAAGNNNKKKNIFPCNYDGVICVGGIDIQGEKVASSNYGQVVDIYAPGEKLISTIPTNMESKVLRIGQYDLKSGTSYAIAHVTALAAALKLKGIVKNSYEFLSVLNQSSTNYSKDSWLPSVDYKSSLLVKNLYPVLLTKKMDTLEVSPRGDIVFEFEVYNPNESISAHKVCLTSDSDILIKDTCFDKEIVGGRNEIKLKSKIKSFDIESWQNFNIKLITSSDEVLVSKKASLQLVKPIKLDEAKVITKIAAGALLRIAPNIKSSALLKVIDFTANKATQDYYVLNNRSLRSIFYLNEAKKEYSPMQIKFATDINVISVLKADMNLDGTKDILVYGTSKDKREYILASYDVAGKPLFGEKSTWKLNATQFGGLNFNRGRPYFNFIKTTSKSLGDVLVPLVSRVFDLPQIDNNQDPIDYLNNVKKKRPYYLLPEVVDEEVKLQIRTLESYDFDSKLREQLDLGFYENLQFVSLLEQDNKSLMKGSVKLIFAVGEVSFNNYYVINFDDTSNFNIVKKKRSLQIHKSNITTIRSTVDGEFTQNYLITRQQERNKLAFKFSDSSKTLRFESEWEDPLSSILAAFDEGEGEYSIYVEGRYNIHLLKIVDNKIVNHSKRSINRESSFPGANFSQIFQMSQIDTSKGAIYTDMQRLFGNNISVITKNGNELSTKLKYHYSIPAQCALIGHAQIDKNMQIRLHCMGPGKLSSVYIHNVK